MHRMRRIILAAFVAVLAAVTLTACTSGGGSGQKAESKVQQTNYNKLVSEDPAHTMSVSPTRNTINKWIDTWGKDPNKLSYVYFINDSGNYTGYYVFKGLPVSYCASLTPTYKVLGSSNGNLSVPAPSIDGVYYSGGECNSYYGFDAVSGAYIEYTVGTSQNVLIYDQPLSGHPNVPNLAPTGK